MDAPWRAVGLFVGDAFIQFTVGDCEGDAAALGLPG
jgi:hypothetical protein